MKEWCNVGDGDVAALGSSAKKKAVDGLRRVLAGVEHELDVALGGEIHMLCEEWG